MPIIIEIAVIVLIVVKSLNNQVKEKFFFNFLLFLLPFAGNKGYHAGHQPY